jgi:hypothetical protein
MKKHYTGKIINFHRTKKSASSQAKRTGGKVGKIEGGWKVTRKG